MNYSTYTTEDFVADAYFIEWVKRPSEESEAFWSAWLSKNPDKESAVREARQIILMLSFKETHAPEGKFLEIWEKISDSADRKVYDISAVKGSPERSRRFTAWYKVAAVFLLAAAAVVYGLLKNTENTVVVQTAYGESRVLFLPDSTKVTLNANSALRYNSGFNDKSREVWLDGEAFFAVVHKKDNQNFRVHTDELQVEVLGTRFNVNTRRGKSKVILEEGKVKLDISHKNNRSEVFMRPGELVEVSGQTGEVEKKEVEAENYSSWRMNKLVFIRASLSEIGQLLEDNYGFKVTFQHDDLKELKFTGSASVDDPTELIDRLNKVFDLNIQRQGNNVNFQYK